MTSFRLNGQLLAVAEELARPVGLTAAWWQVLGAALGEPQSVSEIARAMGLTRQSVQRIADLLVERGSRPTPTTRLTAGPSWSRPRAPAARRWLGSNPAHRVRAEALAAEIGPDRLADILAGMHELSAALDRLEERGASRRRAASTTAS